MKETLLKYFCPLLIVLFMSTMLKAQSQRTTTPQYIALYKDIAIAEMKAFRIPASITLAQGILESENGNSVLARNSNNHFGIKCKAEWTGEKYYHDDDAAQECFRKYPCVKDSYHDHSLFLTSRKHYALLFNLEITDYRGWARGLKQAGYATNPAYAELLINIIETNNLSIYDREEKTGPLPMVKDSLIAKTETPILHQVPLQDTVRVVHNDQDDFQDVILTDGQRVSGINNGVHFITARKDDSYEKIAEDMALTVRDLYHYNDVEKDYKPAAGEKVYIELKKEDASVSFHTVETGESMLDIARLYAIRLKSLYAKNRMKPGTEAEVGQRLWLQDNAPVY